MPQLHYIWKADFKDGSSIKQFEDNKEHLFQEVKDRFSDLVLFTFYHIDKPFWVSVDLQKGLLFVNQNEYIAEDFIKEKSNIRLIVFRRHQDTRVVNTLEEVDHKIYYFIGYQYQDTHGNNRKVVVQLDKDCNIIIGD